MNLEFIQIQKQNHLRNLINKKMADVEFVTGLFVKKPTDQAPDFVKAKLSIKVADIIPFLQEKANEAGYVNVDLLESRGGEYYAKLDDYK